MIKWHEYTWYSKLAALIFFLGVLPALAFYIGSQYQKTESIINSIPVPVQTLPLIPPTRAATAESFKTFFSQFQEAVKTNHVNQISTLMYFPLQTAPIWTNQDISDNPGSIDYQSGLVSNAEFSKYYDNIFPAEFRSIITSATSGDITKVDTTTDEDYYKRLVALTDKNSPMYELDEQFTQSGGNETSFSFVFGEVNRQYKVLSFYSPWPVK